MNNLLNPNVTGDVSVSVTVDTETLVKVFILATAIMLTWLIVKHIRITMALNPSNIYIIAFDGTGTQAVQEGAVQVGMVNLGATDVTVQYAGPRGDISITLVPNIPFNPPAMPGGTYGAFSILGAGKRVVGSAFYTQ
jgi:hypothetical protein